MTITELEQFKELLTDRERSVSEWLDDFAPEREAESRKARALLIQIRDALGRVDSRTYGTCKTCHEHVEIHRLEAQPATEMCLECISKEERSLLEEELYLASKIHRALLPRVARIDGFEVAVRSLAARVVGGDYYDFLQAPNGGALRVVIADSMGKGLPAGMVMSNLQGALRVLAEEIESPAHLVTRLNRWLCCNIPVTNFISLACLALEGSTEAQTRVVHANAGHCPTILVHADGAFELLEATGTVVGVHEAFKYDEAVVTLNAGDMLVLYTDGVTEAEDATGDMFGDGRLIKYARNHRNEPVEDLIDGLTHEVQEFTGSAQFADDFTIIVLRKT